MNGTLALGYLTSFSSRLGARTSRRRFASSSTIGDRGLQKDSSKHTTNSSDDGSMLLFERNLDRNTPPRAAFALSALNTTYWLWYTLDFIPAVNASPLQDLHIDPNVGWGAFALGILINSMTALYPTLLISKLEYLPGSRQLRVSRHDLPFLTPSKSLTLYNVGELTMDPTSSDTKKILAEYKGELSKYQGHLGIYTKKGPFPLLLEVRDGPLEVRNGEIMLQALLSPQLLDTWQGNTKRKKYISTARLKGAKKSRATQKQRKT